MSNFIKQLVNHTRYIITIETPNDTYRFESPRILSKSQVRLLKYRLWKKGIIPGKLFKSSLEYQDGWKYEYFDNGCRTWLVVTAVRPKDYTLSHPKFDLDYLTGDLKFDENGTV